MKRASFLLAAVLLFFSVSTVQAQPTKRVLFVGDSVTEGLGLNPGEDFPTLVGQLTGVDAVNLGCSGSTTRDWNPDITPGLGCALNGAWQMLAVPQLPADAVVLMLGINDSNGFFENWPNNPSTSGYWVSPSEYLGNLLRLVDAYPGIVIVLGPTAVNGTFSQEQKDRLSVYRELVEELAWLHPRVCLGPDVFTLLTPGTPDFQEGGTGLHPSAQGAQKIASALVPAIERHVLHRLPCNVWDPFLGG